MLGLKDLEYGKRVSLTQELQEVLFRMLQVLHHITTAESAVAIIEEAAPAAYPGMRMM